MASARNECARKRRLLKRARGDRMDPEAATRRALRQYRAARKALRFEIKRAKATAWSELIASVEDDPWGLPYRLVTGRLRGASPPMTPSHLIVSHWRIC